MHAIRTPSRGQGTRSASQLAFMGNRPPPNTSTVLASVQRHVQLYSELARTHSNYMRKLAARKLNGEEIPTSTRTRRNRTKSYKIGDRVLIYIPPGQNIAQVKNRRAKHLLRFRGPARVTKVFKSRPDSKSPGSAFEVKMEGSKRVYQRTLANIRPWPKHLLKHPAGTQDDLLDEGGNLIDAKNNTAYCFGRLPIGSIAGIIESEGSKMIHFGRVIKHIGQENVFHMFGTTGEKGNRRMAQSQLAKHAQFLPTFTDTNDGKLILGKKNARRYRHKQWT